MVLRNLWASDKKEHDLELEFDLMLLSVTLSLAQQRRLICPVSAHSPTQLSDNTQREKRSQAANQGENNETKKEREKERGSERTKETREPMSRNQKQTSNLSRPLSFQSLHPVSRDSRARLHGPAKRLWCGQTERADTVGVILIPVKYLSVCCPSP